MSPLQASLVKKAPQRAAPQRLAPNSAPAVSVWTCLVVSADSERRERMRDAAERAGWRSVSCGSVADAAQQAERWRTQLAIFDFGALPHDRRKPYRKFVERLAGKPEPLLMVCDEQSTPVDEVWARQVGVWLYLPEAQLGDDLVELCTEAMRIAEKLAGAPAGESVPS